MLVDLGAKVYAIDINECKVDWITKFIKCNLAKKMMNKSKNALNSGNE